MSSTRVLDQPVVIAVDPHKASWTAAAVSAALAPLATITVQVGAPGYRQLRRFAERWPAVMWAIEGASGPGGPLATRLAGDGIEAVDVPAKRCNFAHHAPITPPWPSTASESGADRFSAG